MKDLILSPQSYSISGNRERVYLLLALVRRNALLLAMVSLTCVALGILYLATAKRTYIANVKLKIETHDQLLPGGVEHELVEKSRESTFFETQLQELRSLLLVNTVLEFNPPLRDPFEDELKRSWFGSYDPRAKTEPYSYPADLLERYLESISVEPIRRTSLVMLRAATSDPDHAMTMANQHAEMFIQWVRNSRVEKQQRAISHLEGQASELREKIAALERQMADYAEENAIVALNSRENIVAQRMAHLNKLLTQVVSERSEAEALAAKAITAGDDDVAIQSTRSHLAKLEAEYEELSQKFTDEYPRMKQLTAEIEKLKRSIAEQRGDVVQGMKAKAKALSQHEAKLRKELEESKAQAFELSRREVPYNSLQREVDTSRGLLSEILKTMKELEVSVENASATVSIVDPASRPLRPASPRAAWVIMISLLAAVLINAGILRVLSGYDTTIHTTSEASEAFEAPLLGSVPSWNNETELLQVDDRSVWSELSEAFRTIRTSLLLSVSDKPPEVIVVTSAEPGEGKTTVVLNLAEALAALGGKVLVIDADIRRPKVSQSVEARGPGLAHLLSGQVSIQDVAFSNLSPSIFVLPAGDTPPNPSELLSAHIWKTLLDEMRQRFAYVLIDSAPVLPVSDALILSRHADGVVLVVRSGRTPRVLTRGALEKLRNVGARVLGITLNDVDGRDSTYYGRYAYLPQKAIGA